MSDEPRTFGVVENGGETPVVLRPVELERARREYRARNNTCDHYRFVVDEELAEVRCRDCNAALNPINVLCRLADRETRFARRAETLRWETKRYEAKSRTTCEHCGKQTRVRPGKPDPAARGALVELELTGRLPEEPKP